jgi:hypothetical protein
MAGTLHNLAVGDPVTQEQIVACDAVPVVLAMTAGDGGYGRAGWPRCACICCCSRACSFQ